MSGSAGSKNSTNVRSKNTTLEATKAGLRWLSPRAPSLAAMWAERLFLTARRHERPFWEKTVLAGARPARVDYEGSWLPPGLRARARSTRRRPSFSSTAGRDAARSSRPSSLRWSRRGSASSRSTRRDTATRSSVAPRSSTTRVPSRRWRSSSVPSTPSSVTPSAARRRSSRGASGSRRIASR